MRTVLFAQLRTHAARLVASTLAIVIAVGFVVATLVLNETARTTVLESSAPGTSAPPPSSPRSTAPRSTDAVDDLEALGSVWSVDPSWETSVQASVPGRHGAQFLLAESVADDSGPALAAPWPTARLPSGEGEVAVSERARADVGDVLTVTTIDAEGNEATSRATVTGIVDLQRRPGGRALRPGLRHPEQAQAWGATDVTELRLAATPGFDRRAGAARRRHRPRRPRRRRAHRRRAGGGGRGPADGRPDGAGRRAAGLRHRRRPRRRPGHRQHLRRPARAADPRARAAALRGRHRAAGAAQRARRGAGHRPGLLGDRRGRGHRAGRGGLRRRRRPRLPRPARRRLGALVRRRRRSGRRARW